MNRNDNVNIICTVNSQSQEDQKTSRYDFYIRFIIITLYRLIALFSFVFTWLHRRIDRISIDVMLVGTVDLNIVYGGKVLPKADNIYALYLLQLEEKSRLHTREQTAEPASNPKLLAIFIAQYVIHLNIQTHIYIYYA
jgi:hypothetical protein